MEQSEQQQPVGVPSVASQKSLFVGDLDPGVKEPELFELFNTEGPVVSVRVCQNPTAKTCYAYVNYASTEDAQKAINNLNFTVLHGKPMRIMYLNYDSTLRRSGTANVFVKNLDVHIDSKILHEMFSLYGPILSCRVATDADGKSKGHGFVQFEKEESAANAIDNANGMTIHSRKIFVGPFLRKEERDSAAATASNFHNLYVKNLSETTSDEDLRGIFGKYGVITSAVVMRNDGKSRCFGFVNFENADDAAKATENLNGKKIGEKEWYVGRAQKKSERVLELKERFNYMQRERQKEVNLYVKNLESDVDERKLKDLFSEHGHVVSAKIIRSLEGQNKGVGFVTYSTPEEARQAMTAMNGAIVGSKALYVAKAQRKEERQGRDGMVNGPRIDPSALYSPGPPLLGGHQLYYGQPMLMPQHPQQANGFGYQHNMIPAMAPGPFSVPNYYIPPAMRPAVQGSRMGRRGVGGPMQLPLPQQQAFPRNSNRSIRYSSESPWSFCDVESVEGGETSTGSEVSPSLLPASASSENRRSMLGEQLYPLVDKLEHERAGKVTGMLLELDIAEIVHLIKSPGALQAKVSEAMDVLRLAQGRAAPSIVDMASLSLSES